MDVNTMSCRLCLQVKKPKKLNSIHEPLSNIENLSIADGIFEISGTKVDQNDRFPTSICNKCLSNLQTSLSFRNLCINSDKYYRNMVNDFESSILLVKNEPIEMPEYNFKEIRVIENPIIEDETHHGFSDDMNSTQSLLIKEIIPSSDKHKSSTPPLPTKKLPVRNKTLKLKKPLSDIEIEEDVKPIRRIRKKRKPNSTKREPLYGEGERCCSVCGKLYKSWKECYNHERRHKKIDKPENISFICDACGKSFKVKSYLVAHLNNSHVTERRYKCAHCPKQFSRSYFYKIHLRYHNNDRPFKCTYCDKGFPKRESLLVHLRSHTGEKPYKCEYCDKAYAHFTDHKRHVFSHTGNYPYKCAVCSKGFAKKSFLTQHEKTHPK